MANIIGAILAGVKLLLFALLLVFVAKFVNFLLDLIPPLNLSGCAGYYFELFGVKDGIDLFISILVYGFTVKYALSFFKNYF